LRKGEVLLFFPGVFKRVPNKERKKESTIYTRTACNPILRKEEDTREKKGKDGEIRVFLESYTTRKGDLGGKIPPKGGPPLVLRPEKGGPSTPLGSYPLRRGKESSLQWVLFFWEEGSHLSRGGPRKGDMTQKDSKSGRGRGK